MFVTFITIIITIRGPFYQITDYRNTRVYILDPCIQEFWFANELKIILKLYISEYQIARTFSNFIYFVFDRFVTNTEVQKLLFNEDQLSVKWGIEFYEEKGRFRRDLANLKASKAVE